MNLALRKEFRLLLPAWIATLVPATVPVWCMHAAWFVRNAWAVQILSVACFGLGALFLALSPFGQETSFGTFSLMLAQPQTRRRLWWIKMSALAAALALSLAALCLSWMLRFQAAGFFNEQPAAFVLSTLWGLAGLSALVAAVLVSGGLWTSLLFRQVTAAFWFSLLAPAAIFGAVWFLADLDYGRRTLLVEGVAMGIYALAGFVLAGGLFRRAQDTPWGSEGVARPVSRGLSIRLLGFVFQEKRSSWAALFCKELQIQQVTLMMAGGLGLIYLAAVSLLMTRVGPSLFIQGMVGAFWMLCLVIPLVVGSVAVAEERNLNTLEGQLCLPARKRSQFAVKLVVVLFLGVLLGAGMPWLLESLTHWAFLKTGRGGLLPSLQTAPGGLLSMYESFESGDFQWSTPLDLSAFNVLATLSLLIAAISFYASTLSRTAIQALGAALLLMVLAFYAFAMTLQFRALYSPSSEYAGDFFSGAWHPNGRAETIWQGTAQCYEQFRAFLGMDLHVYALAWPAAMATFLWLTYGNYRRLQVNQRVWLSNLFGLLTAAVLTVVISNLLYLRPWECFMRLEPAHGPARISAAAAGRLKVATSVANSRRAFFVLLPDGRVWAGRAELPFDRNAAPAPGKFVDSSNWVDLAACEPISAVAIQSDHTLWTIDAFARATRIGAASDWQAVAGGPRYFLALKQDGTLWWSHPDPEVAPLIPLDAGSDWRGAFALSPSSYGILKADGSLWFVGIQLFVENRAGGTVITTRGASKPVWSGLQITVTNWSSAAEHSAAANSEFMAAVTADGALWAKGGLPAHLFGRDCPAGRHDEPVRIGGNSEWREVSGFFLSIAAVERNGALWTQDIWSPEAQRPSEYSDWLAVTARDGCFTALAADGTLSVWLPRYRSIFGLPEPRLKPALSLNIFKVS
jgi:ABC-type transport system involved in multi-copper enzyme maturation permease subunit